ncbi:MAG: M16 family metallopeptidase [Myxococcaceae bacterium]
MNVRPLAAALALLALAGPASAQKPKPFFPYPLKVTALQNGLQVVRVGSRNEVEPEHTGFAHFFEHVMFKGTKAWPEGTRDALLARLGFNENAFTSDDVTVYYVNGPSSGLSRVVEVEADRFKNLDYSEQTFQTEAKAVLGEYHKNAASPGLKIDEELSSTAFTVHPYRHTTMGFYEDIKKMPGYYEYSKQFFKRWYTPDNTLVFIVGDFDDDKLMEQLQQAYGPWQGTAAQVAIPPEPPQKEPRRVHIDWPTPTLPRHLVAWHTPAASTKTMDGAIQSVLSAYLAGPTSPLYKDLVLERQLCESVGSGYSEHRDPSLFSLSATLKEEASRAAVQAAFDAAVKELSSGKVDKKRVGDVKDNLRYSLLMSIETPDHVAMPLAYYAGVLCAPDALVLIYQRIAKVKPADLPAFARRYLVDTNRTVLTLAPKGGQP